MSVPCICCKMATVLRTFLTTGIQMKCVRHGHHMRGKAPGVARSIEQRLNELKADPALRSRVDIGFPQAALTRASVLNERLQILKANRRNTELEKSARQKNLLIDLSETNADWLNTGGPYQIRKIADHYAIYEHLYGDAYFIPRKALQIAYVNNNATESPVLFGNVIKPADATQPPIIHFEADSSKTENEFYSLVMTNLDGHLNEENTEYLHWMIGNIQGNRLDKGELIVDYLQPFPSKGSGFHRFVFILYKQAKLLDFSSLKKQSSISINLADRSFSTFDFYKERQADLTPIGLAFFQSDWDSSLTDFYHNTLNMPEPVFEYDFDAAFIRPQEWFPLRKPFNIYMDKYKDPKEVAERYLKQKLADIHPFEGPKAPVPFPNAERISDKVPSWLKLEMKKKRMGWGRINDV